MSAPIDPTAGLRIREAARALLLDPHDRVLLVRFEFPEVGTRWALPGGGVEAGETHQQALRRELAEEVGMDDAAIGPHIWTRLHIIPLLDGRFDGQRERIHLVQSAAFEPQPQMSWSQLHAEYLFELRWFEQGELRALAGLAPAALPECVATLLRDGPPKEPFDVGI